MSNSVIACQEWVIADVNHDGTSGTVDLFSKTTLTNEYMTFSAYSNTDIYEGSNIDTYLEVNVYNGFNADIKNALNFMHVASNGTLSRHIVAPSLREVGNSRTENVTQEGTIYPIFSPACDPNTKSIFKRPDGKSPNNYWTRTRFVYSTGGKGIAIISYTVGDTVGVVDTNYYKYHIVARIRFAKA